MIRAAAVLLAGGSGTRVGADRNKVLLELAGRPVLAWSRETVTQVPWITHVVLVTKPAERDAVTAIARPGDLIIDGGLERHDSEWQALQALQPLIETGSLDVVALHDGARPLASAALWQQVIEQAYRVGGAVPTRALSGLASRNGRALTDSAGSSRSLAAVATPQAFRADILLSSYQQAAVDGFRGTDTAGCIERYCDVQISAVPTDGANFKITFPEDVALAANLLALDQPSREG